MKNNLQSTIKSLEFDYANSDIDSKNFPAQKIRGKVELIHFDKYISTEDALKELDQKGYEPANLEELLAYAKDGWNNKDWVVALGGVWRDLDGDLCVPCLVRSGPERILRLHWVEDDWGAVSRFAAVRKYPLLSVPSEKPSETLVLEIGGQKWEIKAKRIK